MVGAHSAVVKDSTEMKLSIVTYHTYQQDPNIGHNTEAKTRQQIRVRDHKHTLNLCNHNQKVESSRFSTKMLLQKK